MTETKDHRVLVCGAGPAGLVTAIELARRGVEVEIVDAAETASPLSKAAIIWRRTLEVLHGAVPVRNFLESGRVMAGIRMEADGRLLREVPFLQDSSLFPPGILLPQCETERILTRCLEDLGVRLQRGRRVVEIIARDSAGVTVRLEDSSETRTKHYGWVVGTDGAHSTIRHQLGLKFPGVSIDRRWVLADLQFSNGGPEDHIRMFVGRDGMAGLFPYGGGRWRLVADGGSVTPETPRRDPDRAEVEEILASRTKQTWQIESTPWLAEFRVNERQVERYRHGRILLAGDAAHVHSPAGGQGMNTSIQDAVNLAWKLALVQNGQASEDLIDTYDGERHAVASAVLRGSGRMLQVAMNRTRPVSMAKRWILPTLLGIGRIQREAVRRLSEIDVHYHGGPLGTEPGDRWIGRRCPDVEIGDRKNSVYEMLGDPGFKIFELGRSRVPDADDRGGLLAGPGLDLVWVSYVARSGGIADEARALASALDVPSGTLVVVRPDGYLGPVTSDPDRIRAWFDSLRGGRAG